MSGGSAYSQSSSSGGSAYAQQSSSGGSPYAGGSGPAKKKGRGFFGSVGHWVEQKGERAARDLAGAPTALLKQAEVAAPVAAVLGGQVPSRKQLRQFANLEKQQVKGVVQTGAHPLRDPFLTAVTFAPFASGALRAGEIATGADIGAARTLTQGGREVPLIRSHSALGRAGQNVYDRAVQGALTKNEQAGQAGKAAGRVVSRVAAHGAKRVGGALDEEARVQQRMRSSAAAMLDRSAGRLSKLPKARREDQAALELTSNQTTPQEAAAFHDAQAAKGVSPKRNQHVADIYRRVAARDLVHLDESRPAGEKVFINPTHEALAAADKALARVQHEGDRILVEKGVRPGEVLQERINAPGRIRAGGVYEKPTPGKLGKSPALDRAQTNVNRLQTRFERLAAKPAYREVARPRTVAEAKARLATLETEHAQALDKIAAAQFGPVDRAEVARRNVENARAVRQEAGVTRSGRLSGASGSKAVRRPTVIAERRAAAEQIAQDAIARNPDHPTSVRWQQRVNELDQLRAALNPEPGAKISRAQLGQEKSLRLATAKRDRVGGALSVAKDELQRQERRVHGYFDDKGDWHSGTVKQTGIVGGEQARPGRGYVSEQVSEKKLSRAEASASRGLVVGAAQSPIGGKSYTGRALEQGLRPKNVTASASRHFRMIQKFVNTDMRRRAALATGSDVRRSTRDILVREPDVKAEQIPGHILEALGRQTSAVDTPQELAAHEQATAEGLRTAHEMFRQQILDRADPSRTEQIGAKAPAGYKWVDEHTLGEMAKAGPAPRGAIARKIDTVNSATTALTVYFKVGHLPTRAFTNATTNIIQGSLRPDQAKRSFTMWQGLSEQERVRALAAGGQHGYEAMPHEGVTLVARAATKGAGAYARFVDAPFRFNSLAYELRKIGVDTPNKFRQALDGLESGGQGMPAHEWAKLSAAARRADREAISYDRLNSFERRFIARGIWFYPWLKGASLFAIRSMIEHPYKMSAFAQLGSQGRQEQMAQLGPTPSYEAGLIALGHGARPLTTDLSTFTPFTTPGDIVESLIHPGGVAGMFNPVVGSGVEAATGTNQYGGATTSYLPALQSLFSTTPEQQLLEASQAGNQQNKMFPKSTWGTIARYLAGPATPRHVNRSALAKAAARESSGRR